MTNCVARGGLCPALEPRRLECDGAGPASFRSHHDLVATASNTTGGWRATITLPWTLFSIYFGEDGAAAAARWPLWRLNTYRYDYPDSRDAYELSGWSPTRTSSFHVPSRFGVVVLSEYEREPLERSM